MKAIVLIGVLAVGVLVGFLVLPEYVDDRPDADAICNQQLPGDDWHVNLDHSEPIEDGTRLVCERNDTQRTLTVNINLDVTTMEVPA